MEWTKEIPRICGYYYAVPKERDSWLDNNPEVVYLYFDGKWSVGRPGTAKFEKTSEFIYWYGPLELPELPEEVERMKDE